MPSWLHIFLLTAVCVDPNLLASRGQKRWVALVNRQCCTKRSWADARCTLSPASMRQNACSCNQKGCRRDWGVVAEVSWVVWLELDSYGVLDWNGRRTESRCFLGGWHGKPRGLQQLLHGLGDRREEHCRYRATGQWHPALWLHTFSTRHFLKNACQGIHQIMP